MITCKNCGAGIPDDETFCGQCGAPRPDSDLFAGSPKKNVEQAAPSNIVDLVENSDPANQVDDERGSMPLSPDEPVLEGEIVTEQNLEPIAPKKDKTCLWIVFTCLALLLLVLCVLCVGVAVLMVFFQEVFNQIFNLTGIILVF